jgi:hypothetical protein
MVFISIKISGTKEIFATVIDKDMEKLQIPFINTLAISKVIFTKAKVSLLLEKIYMWVSLNKV